jgi:hypothetical protein
VEDLKYVKKVMVWIYESPFTKKEEAAYVVLKKRFKKYDLAKETVKLLSLTAFLKSQKFTSPNQIRNSAFYDTAKTKPIFNEKTAKDVYRGLKKKGGSDSKYPFTDFTIKNNISALVSYLPDVIEYPVRNIYGLLTTPVLTAKENVPLVSLLFDVIHGATEVGVTTAGDGAEAIGGPIGAAIITPFLAVAGAIASGIAILEEDTGQAVAHMVNVIPLFGSAFGKGMTQTENMVKSLEKHPELASIIPFVGSYVDSKTLPTGGKRFSTQRHKYTKWPKTRRNRSAKV